MQFFFHSNFVIHVQLILFTTLSSNLFELVWWFGSLILLFVQVCAFAQPFETPFPKEAITKWQQHKIFYRYETYGKLCSYGLSFSNAGNTLVLTGIKSKYIYILPFGPISISSIIAVLMHERILWPVYVSTKIGLSENV